MCEFFYAYCSSRFRVRIITILLAALPAHAQDAEPMGLYRPDCNDIWQYEEHRAGYMTWYQANCNECTSDSESLIFLDWRARNCSNEVPQLPGSNPANAGATDPLPGGPETPGDNSGRDADTTGPDDKANAQDIVDIVEGVTGNKPGESRQPTEGDNTSRYRDTEKEDE